METVTTKLKETRRHVTTQGELMLTKATDAGWSFLEETRGAGQDFLAFVGTEAKRWRRFVSQRTTELQSDVRNVLSLPAIERRVLVRVDGTLRAVDKRVRDRLAKITKKKAAPKRSRARKAAPRRAKASTPALAA